MKDVLYMLKGLGDYYFVEFFIVYGRVIRFYFICDRNCFGEFWIELNFLCYNSVGRRLRGDKSEVKKLFGRFCRNWGKNEW